MELTDFKREDLDIKYTRADGSEMSADEFYLFSYSNSDPNHYIYRHYNKNGELLYIGISLSSLNRLSNHKHGSHWFREIETVKIEHFTSREAAADSEKVAIKKECPKYNVIWNKGNKNEP